MEIIIKDLRKEYIDKTIWPYTHLYQKQFVAHDVAKFKSDYVKKLYLGYEPDWYKVGRNHLDEGLTISRDVDCEEYFVNVESAEDLFEFLQESYCDCRFGIYQYGTQIPAIYIRE